MENYRSGKFPLTFSGYGRIYEIPVQAVNLAIRYEESLNNRKAA